MVQSLYFFAQSETEFFESLASYKPRSELLDIVSELLGDGWRIETGGFWILCVPGDAVVRRQGWKIHISGTRSTAKDLLSRLVPLFAIESVTFKFAADLECVGLSTSKNWERTAAGKFITVYPRDDEQFKSLVQQCAELTVGLAGPYILTDQRYPGSETVFYRYGGFKSLFETDPQGRKRYLLEDVTGTFVEDKRIPLFVHPGWVKDPLGYCRSKEAVPQSTERILAGRYEVNGVLRYSNAGGIYQASDGQTGRDVIVRERRPGIGNWKSVLHKEARILQKLSGTGLAPEFIDFFKEGGHLFLVQERILADTMWARTTQLFLNEEGPRSPNVLFPTFCTVISAIADAIEDIHRRGIIIRDISKTNVLMPPNNKQAIFIDWEAAFELDRQDQPVHGGTVGYRSPQQVELLVPAPTDDYFSFGALVLDFIMVIAAGLPLNRAGSLLRLRQTLDDIGFPQCIGDQVESLLDPNPDRRPRPSVVVQEIRSAELPRASVNRDPVVRPELEAIPFREPPKPEERHQLECALDGIGDYILSNSTFHRGDRLWPGSTGVFLTNPVSIRYGAAGVCEFLFRTRGLVLQEANNWIAERADIHRCPPSLYHGLIGVALYYLHVGLQNKATDVLEEASSDRRRLLELPGLYDGAAGWGLANLWFWSTLNDSQYLLKAIECADHLLLRAEETETDLFWSTGAEVPLGLGAGSSGIGLFLLYVHVATGEAKYLEAARRAIRFDCKHIIWHGRWAFLPYVYKRNVTPKTMSPHMLHGSGGLATAAIRFFAVSKEPWAEDLSRACCYTVSSRYTNKLWQDWGLAGFGELLIDAYQVFKDPLFLHNAFYLAQGILPHGMHSKDGLAFPGEELLKISCDYGLGSSGIGMFFHRLLRPFLSRFLFPDSMLAGMDVQTTYSIGQKR